MTTPISITIPHRLGKDEAIRKVKPALGMAQQTFPVIKVEEEIWSGDRMSFRVRALAQVVTGTVTVADDTVRLEVTLPWLLHRFAEVVQATIQARGRVLLEKK